MSEEKHNLVKQEGTTPTRAERETPQVSPPYEVLEHENGFTVRLEMPGVGRDGLEIQADRETLTVRGSREETFAGLTPVVIERSRGDYYREFSMDDTVDWEHAQASVQDGVVILEIPKASHAKPRRIQVT